MKLKLISLNVEGIRHFERVLPFLEKEDPDIICLQEAAEDYIKILEEKNYFVSHLERSLRERDGKLFVDGQLIATKAPHRSSSHYYFYPADKLEIEEFDEEVGRYNNKQGVLVADIDLGTHKTTIATTHFTWAPDAKETTRAQEEDLENLLMFTNQLPPHILCGDFNLSRKHSHLYQKLTEYYNDQIPSEFTSSLDREFHRVGSDPEKEFLFTESMVDYIFTKELHTVRDVRLEFGLSDHAAIISYLEIG